MKSYFYANLDLGLSYESGGGSMEASFRVFLSEMNKI